MKTALLALLILNINCYFFDDMLLQGSTQDPYVDPNFKTINGTQSFLSEGVQVSIDEIGSLMGDFLAPLGNNTMSKQYPAAKSVPVIFILAFIVPIAVFVIFLVISLVILTSKDKEEEKPWKI